MKRQTYKEHIIERFGFEPDGYMYPPLRLCPKCEVRSAYWNSDYCESCLDSENLDDEKLFSFIDFKPKDPGTVRQRVMITPTRIKKGQP